MLSQVQFLINKYPDAKVLLTGHSLGAAVITIAALEIAKIAPIHMIQTYGSPRVGNEAFA